MSNVSGLMNLTLPDLKKKLAEYGLREKRGEKKAQLIARLQVAEVGISKEKEKLQPEAKDFPLKKQKSVQGAGVVVEDDISKSKQVTKIPRMSQSDTPKTQGTKIPKKSQRYPRYSGSLQAEGVGPLKENKENISQPEIKHVTKTSKKKQEADVNILKTVKVSTETVPNTAASDIVALTTKVDRIMDILQSMQLNGDDQAKRLQHVEEEISSQGLSLKQVVDDVHDLKQNCAVLQETEKLPSRDMMMIKEEICDTVKNESASIIGMFQKEENVQKDQNEIFDKLLNKVESNNANIVNSKSELGQKIDFQIKQLGKKQTALNQDLKDKLESVAKELTLERTSRPENCSSELESEENTIKIDSGEINYRDFNCEGSVTIEIANAHKLVTPWETLSGFGYEYIGNYATRNLICIGTALALEESPQVSIMDSKVIFKYSVESFFRAYSRGHDSLPEQKSIHQNMMLHKGNITSEWNFCLNFCPGKPNQKEFQTQLKRGSTILECMGARYEYDEATKSQIVFY